MRVNTSTRGTLLVVVVVVCPLPGRRGVAVYVKTWHRRRGWRPSWDPVDVPCRAARLVEVKSKAALWGVRTGRVP